MRLFDLRLADDPQSQLGIHPRLTIAFGLSPAARALVVSSLEALVNGERSGLVAGVELDGTVTEVGADSALLPRPAAPLSVVVRPQDLLEPRLAALARPVPVAEMVTDEQLAKARARHAAAQASLDALDTQIARLAADLAEAAGMHEAAVAGVAQSHHDLDQAATAQWRAAIAAAQRVEIELGADPGAVRAETIDGVKRRIEDLQEHVAQLSYALDGLYHHHDPAVLERACAIARLVLSDGPVPMPEALALADEWVALRDELAAIEARHALPAGGSDVLNEKLDAARRELASAEVASKPRVVSPDDVAELEAAHEAVLDAEQRSTSRLGGGRARKQLDAALERRQAVLDRLGYPTWYAWVMGDRMLDSANEARRRADQAANDVARLEAQLNALTAKLESDPDFHRVLARLDVVYTEATALVGATDDLEAALRGVMVDPGPPPLTAEESYAELAAALSAVGHTPPDDVSLADLVELAVTASDELHAVSTYRSLIETEVEQCFEEIAEHRDTLSRLEAVGPADDREVAANPRVLAARFALQECQARVDRHRSALTHGASMLAQALTAGDLERRLGSDLAAKRELRDVTATFAETARKKLGDAEAAADAPARRGGVTAESGNEQVVMARYVERRVLTPQSDSPVGPVPVVFDDAFAGLHFELVEALFARLDHVSDGHQIVYFTDDESIAQLVTRELPDTHAAVVVGTGFFA